MIIFNEMCPSFGCTGWMSHGVTSTCDACGYRVVRMKNLYKLEDDKKSLFELMQKLPKAHPQYEWKTEPLYKHHCACGYANTMVPCAKFCPECGTSLEA